MSFKKNFIPSIKLNPKEKCLWIGVLIEFNILINWEFIEREDKSYKHNLIYEIWSQNNSLLNTFTGILMFINKVIFNGTVEPVYNEQVGAAKSVR